MEYKILENTVEPSLVGRDSDRFEANLVTNCPFAQNIETCLWKFKFLQRSQDSFIYWPIALMCKQ